MMSRQASPRPSAPRGQPHPLVVDLNLHDVRERLLMLQLELEAGPAPIDPDSDPASGEHAVDVALQAAGAQKLAQVRAALERIESGTYGLCTDCADPIHEARLAARPFALRCVTCQQLADR
jgi:RNA polymerase-binding transcription factor DksA